MCRVRIHDSITGQCIGPATQGHTIRVRVDAAGYVHNGLQFTVYHVDEARLAQDGARLTCTHSCKKHR
jgi:hypothetical protein